VYAAGEAPIEGATGAAIAEGARSHGHRDARPVASLDEGVAALAAIIRAGDLVLTLGAGDITHCGPQLLERLARDGVSGGASS
jgi:UDP-N-acetylmuramate--alanine ligase